MMAVYPGAGSGPGPGHALGPGNGQAPVLPIRELHISEDENSENSGSKKRKRDGNNDDNIDDAGKSQEGDEGGAQMSQRPRGRPPGSKNKTKLPLIIQQESANNLRAHVLEIANGCDVAESMATFSRRRQRGVSILRGSGTVNNVTLRQPATASAIVTLHGHFEILSLSGAFFPTPQPSGVTGLTICLAGGQGQVVGGSVVGALLASGPVVIMAATFRNAPCERLFRDRDEEEEFQSPGGLSQSAALTATLQQQQQIPEPSSMPIYNVAPPSLLPNSLYAWAQHPRPPYDHKYSSSPLSRDHLIAPLQGGQLIHNFV